MTKLVNRVGQRFGRLTVIERAPSDRGVIWVCRCGCGTLKAIRSGDLASGNTSSCGSAPCEAIVRGNHGHARIGHRSPTYKAWCAMLQRCNNPKDAAYCHYGARGIKVCERWSEFRNFLADMGERPDRMSLERKDNSLGYSQENCCWTTMREQNRNKRSNHLMTKDGLTKCLTDWALETGIAAGTIHERLRNGWTDAQALSIPVKRGRSLRDRLRIIQASA